MMSIKEAQTVTVKSFLSESSKKIKLLKKQQHPKQSPGLGESIEETRVLNQTVLISFPSYLSLLILYWQKWVFESQLNGP